MKKRKRGIFKINGFAIFLRLRIVLLVTVRDHSTFPRAMANLLMQLNLEIMGKVSGDLAIDFPFS